MDLEKGGHGKEQVKGDYLLKRIKDCYKQEWHSALHHMSKLSAYCCFKTMIEPEMYTEFKYETISECTFEIPLFKS